MKNTELSNVLTHLESSKNIFSNAIENNVIERCCYIVEVGALTVGTDDNGKVIIQNVQYPMQFSKNAVDTILSMNWYNKNGEKIEPIVYSRNDWYKTRIKMIEESLELFEKEFAN